MKTGIFALIFVTALAAFIWALPTPSPDQKPISPVEVSENSFVLKNVTFFDGTQWHENSQLTVIDGFISDSVQSQNLPEIDGGNGYVIPGLIDAHTHTWGDALKQALRFGVTTELDMFTSHIFAAQARSSRDNLEKTDSADFYSSGTLVTSTGGHGTEYGMQIPTIDTPEAADQFVQDRIDEGSDYIKVVYNNQPQYYNLTSFSKEVLIAVITAAHKYDKLAVVHISNHASAIDAVEAGADGLVHTFGDQVISDDLLDALKEKQVFVIPTLTVIASMAQSDHSQRLADDPNLQDRLSGGIRAGLKPFANIPARPQYLQNALINTQKMQQAGIPILAGTDATNPGASHGVSIHGELELLVESGLSPTEALQSAGAVTASAFSLGKRGHLINGSKADLILLEADPRQDIKNTRHIIDIWKNGYQLDAEAPTNNTIGLPENGLLSDFSSRTLSSSLQQDFVATTDQMMQGNSIAEIGLTDSICGDAGALSVTGEIKAGFPYAWAGVFLPFSSDLTKPADLSSHQAIEFSVAGSPGQYQLMLFIENTMQPVQIPFEIKEECTTVSIVIEENPQVVWDSVTGLAWVADRSRLTPELASFEFTLDNITIRP